MAFNVRFALHLAGIFTRNNKWNQTFFQLIPFPSVKVHLTLSEQFLLNFKEIP